MIDVMFATCCLIFGGTGLLLLIYLIALTPEYFHEKRVDRILKENLTKPELQRLFGDDGYINVRVLCYSLDIDWIKDGQRLIGYVFREYGIRTDRFEYRLLKPKDWG